MAEEKLMQIETSVGVIAYPKHYERDMIGVAREVIDSDCYGLRNFDSLRVIVDIGCSTGVFALWANHCFPDAEIHCYDPVEWCYECASITCRGLPNVSVHRRLVLNHEDWRSMIHYPPYIEHVEKYEGIAIDAAQLFEGLPVVDLLKIDCEGAELGILKGLADANLIGRIKHIRGEWHFDENFDGIPVVLKDTHHVSMKRNGNDQWNMFSADKK